MITRFKREQQFFCYLIFFYFHLLVISELNRKFSLDYYQIIIIFPDKYDEFRHFE